MLHNHYKIALLIYGQVNTYGLGKPLTNMTTTFKSNDSMESMHILHYKVEIRVNVSNRWDGQGVFARARGKSY